MRYSDHDVPLDLLEDRFRKYFGRSVAPVPGADAVPYRFPAGAWTMTADGDEASLRAAVLQHYFGGAFEAGLRRSLPAPVAGGPGMGSGRGNETRFAARVGANEK